LDGEILPLLPDSADGKVIPQPATNFDGFLGMALARGGMLGSHIYTAVQEGADLTGGQVMPDADIRISLLRADVGINWPLGKNIDGELSMGGARTSYGPDSIDAEWSYFVKARAFSTVNLINGEVVPIFNYSRLAVPGREASLLHFGVGANVSMDRGFFWLGLQGILDEWKTDGIVTSGGREVFQSQSGLETSETRKGVSIGFGIERNIWFEWLVLRVGGRKEITFTEVEGPGASFSYIRTNPTGDMTAGDQVGFGIGLNVEEKLKVDATLAEDLPYTFGNLFSGPHHHVISRISATYSF
jgi:hypothetical protein